MTTQSLTQHLVKFPKFSAMIFAFMQAQYFKLCKWVNLTKSRNALAKLDQRILDDIGLTKDQALDEAQKPFWKN